MSISADQMEAMSISQTSSKMKAKPAIIDDISENSFDISIKDEKSFEIDDLGKREHLETKKQIEDLREEYGVDWLYSKGATKVQNVMGIQASPAKPTTGKSTQTTEQMLEKLFGMDSSTSPDRQRTSTPIQNDARHGHSPTEVSYACCKHLSSFIQY